MDYGQFLTISAPHWEIRFKYVCLGDYIFAIFFRMVQKLM